MLPRVFAAQWGLSAAQMAIVLQTSKKHAERMLGPRVSIEDIPAWYQWILSEHDRRWRRWLKEDEERREYPLAEQALYEDIKNKLR